MEQNATMTEAKRIAAPFTQEELDKIDAWGFARRIRNRSDAVRALIEKGLEATATDTP